MYNLDLGMIRYWVLSYSPGSGDYWYVQADPGQSPDGSAWTIGNWSSMWGTPTVTAG